MGLGSSKQKYQTAPAPIDPKPEETSEDKSLEIDIEDVENLVSSLIDRNKKVLQLKITLKGPLKNGYVKINEEPRVDPLEDSSYQPKRGILSKTLASTETKTFSRDIEFTFPSVMVSVDQSAFLVFSVYKKNKEKEELLFSSRFSVNELTNTPTGLRDQQLSVEAVQSDIGQSKFTIKIELSDFDSYQSILFRISAENKNKNSFILHTSEIAPFEKTWKFKSFDINATQIKDETTKIRFDFFEAKDDEITRKLGQYFIPLINLKTKGEYTVIDKSVKIGTFHVVSCEELKSGRFLRFIHANFFIKSVFAFDFSERQQMGVDCNVEPGTKGVETATIGHTFSEFQEMADSSEFRRNGNKVFSGGPFSKFKKKVGTDLQEGYISDSVFLSRIGADSTVQPSSTLYEEAKVRELLLKNEFQAPDPFSHSFEEFLKPIDNLVQIFNFFDDDQRLPVICTGAKLPPSHRVTSNCFALNGNIFSPVYDLLTSVKQDFKNKLKNEEIIPNGPAVHSELIQYMIDMAKTYKEGGFTQRYYFTLVLMTFNLPSDITQIIEKLTEASTLPISIIFFVLKPFELGPPGRDRGKAEVSRIDEIRSKVLEKGGRDNIHIIIAGGGDEGGLKGFTPRLFGKLPAQFLAHVRDREKLKLENPNREGIKNELIERFSTNRDLFPRHSFYEQVFRRRKTAFRTTLTRAGFSDKDLAMLEDARLSAENLNLVCELLAALGNAKRVRLAAAVSLEALRTDTKVAQALTREIGCLRAARKPKETKADRGQTGPVLGPISANQRRFMKRFYPDDIFHLICKQELKEVEKKEPEEAATKKKNQAIQAYLEPKKLDRPNPTGPSQSRISATHSRRQVASIDEHFEREGTKTKNGSSSCLVQDTSVSVAARGPGEHPSFVSIDEEDLPALGAAKQGRNTTEQFSFGSAFKICSKVSQILLPSLQTANEKL